MKTEYVIFRRKQLSSGNWAKWRIDQMLPEVMTLVDWAVQEAAEEYGFRFKLKSNDNGTVAVIETDFYNSPLSDGDVIEYALRAIVGGVPNDDQ